MSAPKPFAIVSAMAVALAAFGQSRPVSWALPELRCDVVNEPVERRHEMPEAARYVAEFSLPRSSDFVGRFHPPAPLGASLPWKNVLRTEAARELSDAQRSMMRSQSPWWAEIADTRGGDSVVRLLAVSADDAPVLARAALEALNQSRQDAYDKAVAEADRLRTFLDQRRGELAPLQEKLAALEADQAKLVERTGYTSREQVERDLYELERVGRLVEVEIAGIEAKLAAIAKAREKSPAPQTQVPVLDRLQLEQDIELAGALARQAAARQYRSDAAQYLQNVKTIEESQKQVASLQGRIASGEASLQQTTAKIADPPPEMRPVTVIGDLVTIRPLAK